METIIELIITTLVLIISFAILFAPVIIITIIIICTIKTKNKKITTQHNVLHKPIQQNKDNISYNPYTQPIQQNKNNISYNPYTRPIQQIKPECPYQKRELLTRTEYNFYKILKEECDKQNYLICPKVRMEDFLEVKPRYEKMKYRGYIKSRHIDFIICNQEMKMICGIELDDASHHKQKAKEIDKFKNDVFKGIEIPLFRIIVGHGFKEQLEKIFYVIQQRNTIYNP